MIDQRQRMTASEALAHPWLAQPASSADAQQPDLLPALRKNFNAKRTWKRAILGVRAAGALKAGGEARRATMLSEMDLGQEQQEKMREQAHLAKRDAEEESVSRLCSELGPAALFPRRVDSELLSDLDSHPSPCPACRAGSTARSSIPTIERSHSVSASLPFSLFRAADYCNPRYRTDTE